MALWGAFGTGDSRSSVLHACEASLAQQRRLASLNDRIFERHGISFRVRMGLSFGEAIVGNIGSLGKKIEFTALGDTVNLASRLEGANKFYGTRIITTESIAHLVGDAYVFRRLDRIRVKGKNDIRTIYELVGAKAEVDEATAAFVRRYEEALDRYIAGEFVAAQEEFASLVTDWPTDEASHVLLARCERHLVEPPADWDGAYSPSAK